MNRKVYKHLLSTYGKKPGIWFAFFAETFRTIITRVVTVILLANMAASVAEGDFESAKMTVILWAALTIAASLLSSAGELVGLRVENNVYSELLIEYYQKLTNKDMGFYRDKHTGYLTAMFRQYLDSAMLLNRMFRGDMLRVFISLTFPAIVLLFASWPVGLVATLLVVTQVIYMVWSSRKANKYRLASDEIYRKISGEVADDVTNIVAYKSAGKEEVALKKMNDLCDEETDTFWKRKATVLMLDFPRNIITILLIAASFWLALDNSSSSGGSVGLLVLTITYMFQIIRSAIDLPEIFIRQDDLITRMEPAMSILDDEYEDIKDANNSVEFSPGSGKVEIKGLTFKYTDDSSTKEIFKNFNLKITGGERIGIVGLSGAGKSTLANLLMRFDDIQSGQILIDDVDIKQAPQSALRANIAYVPQEPLLFHRTIRDNIAYHNHKSSLKDVKLAAKAAHIHEFIMELPKKYDTVVGERGVKLSGGQKQRVVIARAVLKKAPLILFDEATSALDSESEHIIQKALPEIIGEHTAIIIAHRLSTVARLDRIIVMDEGKITEEGTHEQLLKKKGRYAKLWARQISEEVD